MLDPNARGSYIIGLDVSLDSTGIAAISAVDMLVDGALIPAGKLYTSVHASKSVGTGDLVAETNRYFDIVQGIVSKVVACDPVVACIENLRFGTKEDTSLPRRGYVWWNIVHALISHGVPVIEIAPSAIKKFATTNGRAAKTAVVANYAAAWPEEDFSASGLDDRADAVMAASMLAMKLGIDLPLKRTALRGRSIAALPEPSTPLRWPELKEAA